MPANAPTEAPRIHAIYVRVPVELWTDVKIEAAKTRRSVRAVAEAALTLYLKKHPTQTP